MKIAILILIILHGTIHFLGFAKAYNLVAVNQLTQNISKINGMLWLVSALLFMASAILFFLQKEWWWMISLLAVVISQYLIFKSWQDAKFGTIANVIILIIILVGYRMFRK